jgi:hypothetical protein
MLASPASLTCPLDSGTILNGDSVFVFTTDQGETPTFNALSGGGTFTTYGHADSVSTPTVWAACANATGTSSGVTVSGYSAFLPRIRFVVLRGLVHGCTVQGSPGQQGSNYFSNGTTIDTGSSFNIAANSEVVAAVYGVNGGSVGGIVPAAGLDADDGRLEFWRLRYRRSGVPLHSDKVRKRNINKPGSNTDYVRHRAAYAVGVN